VKWLGQQLKVITVFLRVEKYFGNTRLGGKQEDFRRRVHLADGFCQLHAVHSGHHYVGAVDLV
jgi:hypothetical protein